MLLIINLCFLLLVNNGESARILGFFPTPSISHQSVFQPVWKELSLRGHELVVVTTDPLKDKSLTNLTEIDLHDLSYGIWKKHNIGSLGSTSEKKISGIKAFIELYTDVLDAQFGSPEVQALIHDKNQKFDLILAEFLWPTSYALKEVWNVPLVGIASIPFGLGHHDIFGNPSHPITHPDVHLPFSGDLSFWERVQSVLFSFSFRIYDKSLEKIFNKQVSTFFPEVKKDIRVLERQASLAFVSVNPGIYVPRPNVPNVIEISGMHIKPPKPLPKDLKQYLDNSMRGVIYLSFGSNVKSNLLPKDKLQMIMDALSELPYDVLWKFEADLPNKPKNVQIRNWLPQQDILRHPNVKLFIMQGGLQSIEEAIYSKVPLVVVPFFADQPGNARKVEDIGIGRRLDFLDLTKQKLIETVHKVMDDPSCKEKITNLANVALDKPMSALDTVVWWTEYVIRHKGAYHLRSPAIHMPYYKYFMLDVFGFLAVCGFTIIYVFMKLTKMLLTCRFVL
ncbi:PREDICTED: UDP-glucuronosyltransferase 2B9-like [Nicrophorus vespilloides]|uniref:UDP-glucuronosyltransferase n=1 Tax=Nicrophorus vespilloides TaxID=110193 RepID=A0ABM1NIW4_NICVS|nr:PREDICTED: UDP-glucuronosyltransferase 2B9-like [Nicrophorus vespilloides]